ncbi:ASCH domain protein [compost metagenome]
MKAITILQPWATLIAIGEKKFETRSWSTKHRGQLAIHAGKKVDRAACEEPEIKEALARHGYTVDNLPIGAVVAVCDLMECWKIQRHDGMIYKVGHEFPFNELDECEEIWGNELAFGWYDDGRYAWELSNVQRMSTPIRAKGQQGLWNWEEITC